MARHNDRQHPEREASGNQVDAGWVGVPERRQREADEGEDQQDQGEHGRTSCHQMQKDPRAAGASLTLRRRWDAFGVTPIAREQLHLDTFRRSMQR